MYLSNIFDWTYPFLSFNEKEVIDWGIFGQVFSADNYNRINVKILEVINTLEAGARQNFIALLTNLVEATIISKKAKKIIYDEDRNIFKSSYLHNSVWESYKSNFKNGNIDFVYSDYSTSAKKVCTYNNTRNYPAIVDSLPEPSIEFYNKIIKYNGLYKKCILTNGNFEWVDFTVGIESSCQVENAQDTEVLWGTPNWEYDTGSLSSKRAISTDFVTKYGDVFVSKFLTPKILKEDKEQGGGIISYNLFRVGNVVGIQIKPTKEDADGFAANQSGPTFTIPKDYSPNYDTPMGVTFIERVFVAAVNPTTTINANGEINITNTSGDVAVLRSVVGGYLIYSLIEDIFDLENTSWRINLLINTPKPHLLGKNLVLDDEPATQGTEYPLPFMVDGFSFDKFYLGKKFLTTILLASQCFYCFGYNSETSDYFGYLSSGPTGAAINSSLGIYERITEQIGGLSVSFFRKKQNTSNKLTFSRWEGTESDEDNRKKNQLRIKLNECVKFSKISKVKSL